MSLPSRLRRFLAWAPLLLTLFGLTSCSRDHDTAEELRVKADFISCQAAILKGHADQVVRYLPQDVGEYFRFLNSGGPAASPPEADAATSSSTPGVNLLLRTALDEKVPRDLRPRLTLQMLLQRIADRGMLNSREIRDASLGLVSVKGDRASAELFFQGRAVPVRVPFIRQRAVWKIDLLALLPFAEVLMRLDRAVTRQTETQQVEQLVAPLPPL